jgi:undecaprenyl-phosphate 4-deoxy-4-formamido-L-arabinose transferase
MGVILFGIGLVGEYVGRIYQQVRARPRYVVATILQGLPGDQHEAEGLEKRKVSR